MSRPKTISDDEVLHIARDVFRARGHTASTREVARAAGISEAVLYQRFGSKDHLFFAAMHATGPDIDELLGPEDPPGNARAYLLAAVVRIGEYFAGVIPLALHVMTHPAFDPATFVRAHPRGAGVLQDGLAVRLAALARRKQIDPSSPAAAARVLVSLAHDWALAGVLTRSAPGRRTRELKEMVQAVWEGLRPR